MEKNRQDAGQSASSEQLREALATASAQFIEGSLKNPAFQAEFCEVILKNPHTNANVVRIIARRRDWTRSYEIKRLLVQHPKTPATLARSYLPHLYWRDLVEVADDLRIHPTIRRQAEKVLDVRVTEMSLGERIALARRATRGLIKTLTHTPETPVIEALLSNPRWVEADAVHVASSSGTPPTALESLAKHPTWGRRLAVRHALCLNLATPPAVGLRILSSMRKTDLRQLLREDDTPRWIEVAATRLLEDPSKVNSNKGSNDGPSW